MGANYKVEGKVFDGNLENQNKEQNGVLLIELTQLQELKVEIAMSDAAIERLDGPLDEIKWSDTKLACAVIIQALTRCGVIAPEELFIRPSFVHEKISGSWNTSVRLYWRGSNITEDSLKIASSIIQKTMQAMVRDPRQNNKDFFEVNIREAHQQVVNEVAMESLARAGGRAIRYPIQVDGPQFETCILDGKFAPKPSKAKFEPVVVQLMGKVRGFIHSHEKCVVFFNDDERGLIEIAFDARMVGDALNLMDLTRWNIDLKDCQVRAHQTIGSNGVDQFTLVCFLS